MSADGGCTVGGTTVAPTDGEPLHEAVLDYLHRLAMATGHAVLATVYDGRSGYVTPIEVLVDGSSRFAGEPGHWPELMGEAAPEPVSPPAAEAVPAAPSPAPAPLPEPSPAAAPEPSPAAAPEPPAPVTPAASAASVTAGEQPSGAAPEAVPEVPAFLAEAVTRINEAIRLGNITSAAAMAEQSRASAVHAFGEGHPHVLHLRELSAYVAYLAGDPTRSLAISLDTARAWHDRGDPRAYQSVLQAAAAWRAVTDAREGLRLGEELIALWAELASVAGPAAADITQLEAARRRMGRLAERTAGQARGSSELSAPREP
ncbi:hypothetical protein ADZ36_08585 [Streptomyces fradiae]|uniref:Uncharacterized protein n=1 Tax=Streptomyces fradiae TaxID=1906 RepID=A0ACC4WE35_STRFR|nr:hypothetical protein ADZ36_08585 [Streptomyces fradiae]OFA48788.1 hypothetical protein BEN35_18430 [Streptomyces fradiae]